MPSETNASERPIAGKRLALTIGVNETCSSLLPSLNHPITDAQLMAEVLEQQCGFELFMPPLLGEQASSEAIRKAIRKLARDRSDDDFLLLYFSGHGLPWRVEAGRDAVYLGSCDFDERDVEDEEGSHISLQWLRERLFEGTQAGRVLLILDCCFSGAMGTTAPDHYLVELRQRIAYYFEAPGVESQTRSGGLRLALTATGHKQAAAEGYSYGLMTSFLFPALRGEVPEVLEVEQQGQISLQRLHRYLELVMPKEQPPSLSGDFAGRSCILASYPERAAQFRRTLVRAVGSGRPTTYIPFPCNPLFQPRLGEFEELETLLFERQDLHKPLRLGLVGVVGMGGIGKTQLAIELAYREQQRFPSGIFWMPAIGKTFFEWQRHFAELAFNMGYLPPDDDVAHPEIEARRARYFCRYLAQHADALLILDNVEDPMLVVSALPQLAGEEVACPVLYTSRSTEAPPGVTLHTVERLSEDAALKLLLAETRAQLLAEIEEGYQSQETEAAKQVCQRVGYLPLALVHLRSWLGQDRRVTLTHLLEVLGQQGALSLMETLFATFQFSWERVQDEGARLLFKLACYYPEATPIPLWLLGLASGLGEQADIFEPLGQACMHLHQVSLLEELSGEQVRLHPLVRAFGLRLIAMDNSEGKSFLEKAGKRLADTCTDSMWLEERARSQGYRECLEQMRLVGAYLEWLGEPAQAEAVRRVERWMDRESYLLADSRWWPEVLPELFYQQLTNRSLEAGQAVLMRNAPTRWIRQTRRVAAEDLALLRLCSGHTDRVSCLAFSPDGKLLVSGSFDHTVRLWEVSSGKQVAQLEGHTNWVDSVAFSPDGKLFVSSSSDRTIRLWEVSSGKQLAQLQGHTDWVNSVVFSPDGRLLVSGSDDKTVRLWEVSSGKQVARLEGHTRVSSVAISPDGKQIASGSSDRSIRLWEVGSGKQVAQFQGHRYGINSVVFSPDGKQIASGSSDRSIRLWEVGSGKQVARLQGHTDWVNSVAFSPDGKLLVTGSSDRTVRLWEVSSGKQVAQLEGHTNWVYSVAFSSDGKQIASGSSDRTIQLWEVSSGKQVTQLEGHIGSVRSVEFSPDGQLLVSGGSDDRTIQLWEVSSGKQVAQLEGHTNWVNSVAFSPDGKLLVSGSGDRTIRLWEVSSGKQVAQLQGHTDWVNSVGFSPDGKQIVSALNNRTIQLWEVSSGRQVAQFQGHRYGINSVAFSPDGKLLVSGSNDRTVRLWEVSSGKQVARLQGHTGWVNSVVFSPDGKLLVSGSDDGTAQLWEVSSGKQLAQLQGHTHRVSHVAFSPDGRLTISCNMNGQIYFWQACQAELGHLLGIYVANYEIRAIHWQDERHVVLADIGPQGRPHFYWLALEGM